LKSTSSILGYEEYKKARRRDRGEVRRQIHRPRGKTEVLEGDWNRSASWCLEFESADRARNGSIARNIANRAKCVTAQPDKHDPGRGARRAIASREALSLKPGSLVTP